MEDEGIEVTEIFGKNLLLLAQCRAWLRDGVLDVPGLSIQILQRTTFVRG